MPRKCSVEGCERTCWSGGVCLWHTPKVGIKKKPYKLKKGKKILKQSEKGKIKAEKKKENTKKMHLWFVSLFLKRMNINENIVCFESGKILPKDVYMENSCIYSHYFPKSTYPQYAFEEWNLELVHPDIHAQWEINQQKCPKMYKKYQELKEKYGK